MKRKIQSIAILTSILSQSESSPTARVESASTRTRKTHYQGKDAAVSVGRINPRTGPNFRTNSTFIKPSKKAENHANQKRHDKNSDHRQREYTRKRLHSIANSIMYSSSDALSQVLLGTVAGRVPAELYGQTLQQELSNCPFSSSYDPEENQRVIDGKCRNDHQDVLSQEILKSKEFSDLNPLQDRKLYGGAQYHRTLQSFHHLIYNLPIDEASSDEIALLIHGISDTRHDGEDLLRSVAILSSTKMEFIMDTLLIEMARRVEFVLLRMWDVVEFSTAVVRGWKTMDVKYEGDKGMTADLHTSKFDHTIEFWDEGMIREIEKDIKNVVKETYVKFVREKVRHAYTSSMDDMKAMFRFVSWDLALGDANGSHSLINIVNGERQRPNFHELDFLVEDEDNDGEDLGDLVGGVLNQGHTSHRESIDSHIDNILMEVIEAVQATGSLCHPGEALGQTGAAVNVLVQHVTKRWRIDIAQIVMTKFNSLCLQPLHEEFGSYLRKEMNVYIEEVGEKLTNN